MFASNQNNTLCMHVITNIAAALSIKIYIHLESANMSTNEETLVGLQREKHFQFTYTKRINGLKLFRKGSEREAIVSEVVEKKIKLYDPDIYQSFMEGKKDWKEVEEYMTCDFWYSSQGRIKIFPWSGMNISYFASLKEVYFCRHLRDHRIDYRWLAVTFFLKKYPMYRNND